MDSTPLRCRRGLRLSSLLVMAVIWVATGVQPSYSQIILDGPNVSGNVGLNGETFGSASVYVSWSGGNVQTNLVNGDTDFSVRVKPDQMINVSTSMYSLQDTTNAYVTQTIRNITGPLSSATEPLSLDLTRDAGRIIGRVTVEGGAVSQLYLTVSTSISSTESYSGNARATADPFDAILPFVATVGVTVRGTASLRADAGCDLPVTLDSQTIDVPVNGEVTATWNLDLTAEQCNQGSIQGQVTIDGLNGLNGDAVVRQERVQVSGPVSRSQNTDESGNYSFADLAPGSYYVYNYTKFNAPYQQISWPGVRVDVGAGDLVTQDFGHSVGTIHAAFELTGAWDLSVVNWMQSYFQTYSDSGAYLATSYDSPDLTTGEVDYIVPAGTTKLAGYYPYFYSNDGVRRTSQYFYHYFYNDNFPLQTGVGVGDRRDLGVYPLETSEALEVFQPANPAVGLTSLLINGVSRVLDASNRQIEYRSIYLRSDAGNGAPENSVGVLVRGVPGTYQMTVTGQGDDGATYSKQYELVLGAPENTREDTDIVNPIVDPTGEESGSITFDNVTVAGETTASQSESGPQAPKNFRVFGKTKLYYDIRTTAEFDVAKVCLTYDATKLTAKQEKKLSLDHYVCTDPQTNTGCTWEDITKRPEYPDTIAKEVCGYTNSFSIFALFLPLDEDDDGVVDAEDNCPAVANADQADFDGDGNDDTADNCPYDPNPDQRNMDDDEYGDACDEDIDGDSVLNEDDNCPLHENVGQADFDGDGLGDACDSDDDNDTVDDGQDACAGTPPAVLISDYGCSSGRLLELECPSDDEYRNHGQYVKCIAHEAEQQVEDGLITDEEKDAIVGTAAKSDIGKK